MGNTAERSFLNFEYRIAIGLQYLYLTSILKDTGLMLKRNPIYVFPEFQLLNLLNDTEHSFAMRHSLFVNSYSHIPWKNPLNLSAQGWKLPQHIYNLWLQNDRLFQQSSLIFHPRCSSEPEGFCSTLAAEAGK